MKVLIISPGTLPITGDHGGAIQNLVKLYLDNNETRDDEFVVYSVKINNKLQDLNTYKNTEFRCIDKSNIISKFKLLINKILIKTKIERNNYYIKSVIKDIKRKKEINMYDLIIFENGIEYIEYFSKTFVDSPKKVLHLHNDYLNKNIKNAYNIVGLYDEIWCVSDFLKSRVEEIGNKNTNIKCLYNTVLKSRFEKSVDYHLERYKLGIEDDEFVYLYVGRVYPEKGLTELVDAFNQLNYKDTRLLIVGSGKKILKKKDKYIEFLKKQSNDKVIFLGQVNNNELYKYYKIANIQMIPSICNEAFGLIALEGVICGLPCITTGSGGLAEIYEDSALYVDKTNLTSELIIKMKYVYDNYSKLCKNNMSYKRIVEKYSLEKYCDNFYRLIHADKKKTEMVK